MDTNLVLDTGFNELVFENRHKSYGAYQIRKRYSTSVLISGLMATATLLGFVGIVLFTKGDTVVAKVPDGGLQERVITVVGPYDPKKDEQPKEAKETKVQTPPAKGSSPDTDPQIVKEAPPVNRTDSVGNPKGQTGGTGSGPVVDTMSVGCKDCIPKDTTTVIPTVVFASDPPVFDGIDLFFTKNIKYPVIPKEQGIEGTVWLSWIVNTKGEVENVEVAKTSKNALLDREALRVAKLMPRWTPGKDNGKPVNFIYRKPIRFQLQ